MKISITIFSAAILIVIAAANTVRAQDPDDGSLSDQVYINSILVLNMIEGQGAQYAPAFGPAPGVPNGAVLFYSDPGHSILSDQFFVFNQAFYFASDPDLQDLTGFPVLASLTETGAPQEIGGFFPAFGGSIQVLSDVPEPSSLLLACAGGGLLWALRRRR